MDIKSYFKPISEARFKAQTALEAVKMAEELAIAQEAAQKLDEEKRIALEKRVAEAKVAWAHGCLDFKLY